MNTTAPTNGLQVNGFHTPTIEELEKELPVVYDGQFPLQELVSRVVQTIYAELSELTETMPNMSDSARKRTLADWVVKTKKQVVKLYAVARWARDSDTVQKCMNITAFLMNQNKQFEDVMTALNYAKTSLDPARLRNHDLLTSLDVLTTGSYRRLPSGIKKLIIEPPPLTDAEITKTLSDMGDAIRYRLRMTEIVPVEMSKHFIADGRVYFTVPHLFEASLCLRGIAPNDGWFFVHVEFLINIGGDMTGMHEFPREPTGIMKRHISDEADARLAFYLPSDQPLPPNVERPTLPEGVVDTPLVRVFNFLQMMSLSYQLEILWYQAERMRSLGWAEPLKVEMSRNRKTLTVSYWIRKPPQQPPQNRGPTRPKQPPGHGGTLTISIVEAHAPAAAGGGPARSAKNRVLADLQLKSKLGFLDTGGVGMKQPSDEVEGLKFELKWEPVKGALGVVIPQEDMTLRPDVLVVNADNLDFEGLLRRIIEHHTVAILRVMYMRLTRGPTRTVFAHLGAISLIEDGQTHALKVHLVGDEHVVMTVDPRTGSLSVHDTGDLAAAGRAKRFEQITKGLYEAPEMLYNMLLRLRLNTITDILEQKAKSLGLKSWRMKNFEKSQLRHLGAEARGTVYIQLANLPNHFLVIVITDEDFRYALIVVKESNRTEYGELSPNLVIQDIAWLDAARIRGEDPSMGIIGAKRKRDGADDEGPEARAGHKSSPPVPVRFNLDIQVLRELYAYCCARIAYSNVENQFKTRKIPYEFINPMSGAAGLEHIQSSLARSVPALSVQSAHILAGAPAAEAAMPKIRVIALNWWSEKRAQVVTCVKLKYVQQPIGRTAGTSTIIRPNKRIIYDTTEAVVSFLSENVSTCVDEFLEEWARVSKMVVIAREIAQMSEGSKNTDVRLLSFDLQTVEFAYASDYTVSITCTDQLSPTGGNFDLRFSRSPTSDASEVLWNPHEDAETFLCGVLRHGHGRLAPSIHRLVNLLRDTLPIVVELDKIQMEADDDSYIGMSVETFPKAAGWYRILYGDTRHALDLRLMSDQRVAILDGSHSLYRTGPLMEPPNIKGKMLPPKIEADDGMTLRPIPQFRETLLEAVREVEIVHTGGDSGKAATIDVGLICDTTSVAKLARSIHSRILKQFNDAV